MTKIQYNQRPFIYRSREDIDAFLEESQLWRDIYEVFLFVTENDECVSKRLIFVAKRRKKKGEGSVFEK